MQITSKGDFVEKLLLKPSEAAEVIGVGRTRIYELLRANAIPSRRVGKSIRIAVTALRAWAESQDDAVKPGRQVLGEAPVRLTAACGSE